jgi:DNA mismatch repair protein MutS
VLVEAGVTAAAFDSILFDRPSDVSDRDDPSMFGDLNLDQVFAALAAGREEYQLMPFFRSPLRDIHSVEYRHEILRDLENMAVSGAVTQFADGMREMRKHLAQANKLRARYQKERWFLDEASIYRMAVAALADALAAIDLSSRGFIAFRQYLAAYTQSAAFTELVADIARVTRLLDEVRYCVNIRGNQVKVTRYEGEADYGAEVQQTFAKFAENPVKDYRVASTTFLTCIMWRNASLDSWLGCFPMRSRRWTNSVPVMSPISTRRSGSSTARSSSMSRILTSSRP